MTRRFPVGVLALGSLLAAAACAPAMPPDTRAEDEAAIRAADQAFSAAANSKDVDAAMAFYADDAIGLPPNAPMSTGRDAIRAEFSAMMAMPGFSLTWSPTRIDVASSGDLGYSVGTAQFSATGPDGQMMSDTMKYATVWRKQADGSWKVVVDAFNSNTPLPMPAK
jgi:uncharacterized protein (TIGR02246 family)